MGPPYPQNYLKYRPHKNDEYIMLSSKTIKNRVGIGAGYFGRSVRFEDNLKLYSTIVNRKYIIRNVVVTLEGRAGSVKI